MTGIITELKRRNVFKVAAFYVVMSWALIEVAATIAPMLSLPEFAPRLVLFLLLLLFPVSMVLTWAYEITPEGIRLDDGTLSTGTPVRAASPYLGYMLLVLVVAGGLTAFVLNRDGGETTQVDVPDYALDKSIAVLPFVAFSSDPDEQFFADGLSDTLLHKLAQLSDIRVISRTSSFQFRDNDIDVRDIGNQLQVATILEGSVQRSNNQLRIIAQLVNTSDGGHIWSKTFDRPSADIFAIQDEISDAVVETLQVSMSPREESRLENSGTDSVQAYERLTMIKERMASIQLFEQSAEEFQQQMGFWLGELDAVLELDPEYAEVYRTKADLYQVLVFQGGSDERGTYFLEQGFEAIHQAMLLEPDNPTNLMYLASLERRSGNSVKAEVFARMAFSQLPNNIDAIIALLLALGDQDKNHAERLRLSDMELARVGPNPFTNRRRSYALRGLGRLDEALELLEGQLANSTEPQLVAGDYATNLSLGAGRHGEAMAVMTEVRRSLEDNINDVLMSDWSAIAIRVGLYDEAIAMAARMGDERRRLTYESLRDFHLGDLQGAMRRLRDYASTLDRMPSSLQESLASLCMAVEDYNCVLETLFAISPNLRATELRGSRLQHAGNFPDAIMIAFSLRQLGEGDAANDVLTAIMEYMAPRTYDGFFSSNDYQLAMYYLLLGDEVRALELMEERIMKPDGAFIPQCLFCSFDSPIYAPLQDNPRFRELVAEYDRRYAAATAEVDGLIAQAGF